MELEKEIAIFLGTFGSFSFCCALHSMWECLYLQSTKLTGTSRSNIFNFSVFCVMPLLGESPPRPHWPFLSASQTVGPLLLSREHCPRNTINKNVSSSSVRPPDLRSGLLRVLTSQLSPDGLIQPALTQHHALLCLDVDLSSIY